jgi:C-terminal processing protease CtpA/Prc
VNALAPGVTAFGFEYRDQESARIKQSAWRGDAEWGIAAFAKTPLFLWVSSHSTELVEAAATTLREERGAILLGEKTTGTGRLKHWQRLSKDRWFGFTVANVLDGRGAPLRDRPLYPDACPASGDFVPLQERSEAGYTARCLDPGMPANLEAALRYVSVAAKKTQ